MANDPSNSPAPPAAPTDGFRLVRHFSWASFLAVVAAVMVLATYHHSASHDQLLAEQTRTNSALARALGNALWSSYGVVMAQGWQTGTGAGPDSALLEMLRNDVERLTAGLNVVDLALVSGSGRILYSRDASLIGSSMAAPGPLAAAMAGRGASALAHEPVPGGTRAREYLRTVATTYLPLHGQHADRPEAVLVVRSDVSEAEAAVQRVTRKTVVGTAFALLALYLFLLVVVSRADRIIHNKEVALSKSEANNRLLALAVEQSSDAVIFQDLDRRILRWNRGAERLFGYAAEEALGRTARDLHLRFVDDTAWVRSGEMLRSPDSYTVEGVSRTKAGADIECEVTVTPVRNEAGERIGHVVISRDVTERRGMERELFAAKERAEAASRTKSEFLANMSHEIRTPMNAIVGMTDLALDCDLPPEPRDYISTVKTAAGTLLTLIDDILDFSKIEAGKLTIEAAAFDLRASLAQCVRTLALGAQEKDLELVWSVAPDVPDALLGDPVRMRQVLVNLLGNAIKFTARGEIEVTVEPVAIEEEACWLHFCVRDTGIGIPADKQRTIFDAFAQADGSTTRQFGGTGLGLTISARLVEMMGGRIAVESVPGEGSAFHFTVRLARRPEAAGTAASPIASTLAGVPVLVVDDNAASRRLLAAYLSSWGMAVTQAGDMQTALETADRIAPGYALIDSILPDGDGFELAGRIAHGMHPGRIVMLTPAARRGETARCREHGYGWLAKPISQSDLFDAITRTQPNGLAGHPGAAAEKNVAIPLSERSLRVLLAEDNAINRKLAVRILEKMGHTVSIAVHGSEAVEACSKQEFDLVLMDMQMPVMDGLEATRRIRALQAGTAQHTPIVAMTANAMQGDRELCIDAGMDGYVAKPIAVAVLQAEIDRVTPPRSEAPRPGANAVLDTDVALRRVGGDADLLCELFDIFVTDAPGLMAQLVAAADAGDKAQAGNFAHAVKGSAGNLSALALAEAAATLEHAIRSASADDLSGLVAAVRAQYERLLPVIATERARLRARAA